MKSLLGVAFFERINTNGMMALSLGSEHTYDLCINVFFMCFVAVIVVVRMDGQPYLCKTDEVGEICVHSSSTGAQYWGLQGLTNQTFKVQPLQADGTPVSDSEYVRSGLLGFLGPVRYLHCLSNNNGLVTNYIFIYYFEFFTRADLYLFVGQETD